MIAKNAVVLYKNQCALVSNFEDEKYTIQYISLDKKKSTESVRVREKDIVLLHEGPAVSLQEIISFTDAKLPMQILEVHELLLSDSDTSNKSISIEELASLLRTSFKVEECFFIYESLLKSFEFARDEHSFKNGKIEFLPRSTDEVESLKKKNYEKEHAEEERLEFIKRLKQKKLILPNDAKYMGDVEALALGKTDKSKTMQDAHFSQSQEKAHKLLLDTGIWTLMKNPYPARFGLSSQSARETLQKPPEEERLVIPEIAYAIDNAWSADPDDAISWDGRNLWIHIADPASAVMPDSAIDKAARSRGTTLYLPEGTSRMLAEDSLADYALGLSSESLALSFKIIFSDDGSIEDCNIFKTRVRVKRLTYEEASIQKDTGELKIFFEIAKRNHERRLRAGATAVNLPEVHISVDVKNESVTIEQEVQHEAADMIQEMMLLAGEGAARFAFKNNIPFPYVSQEPPDIPKDIPEGLAGKFKLLKSMRKRSVGVHPGPHAAIGVSFYSQVTSPLRRYSDLIAHEQLRAFLDKRKLIDKDTMLLRISEGDAASIAARKASRLSELHWKLVYLLKNPEWSGEAVCIDQKDKQVQLYIPSLDLQTFINDGKKYELNESCKVIAKSIDIVNRTVQFIIA